MAPSGERYIAISDPVVSTQIGVYLPNKKDRGGQLDEGATRTITAGAFPGNAHADFGDTGTLHDERLSPNVIIIHSVVVVRAKRARFAPGVDGKFASCPMHPHPQDNICM